MTRPHARRAATGLARALLGLSLALGPMLPVAAQELDPADVSAGAPTVDRPVDPCQPPYSDRDTACVLTQSAETYGYLDAGQFSVYRVDAPAPQSLKAELLDLASDLDLYLYDSGNQEWAESVQEDTTPEVVDLTLPKLESYYLYVVADAGRPIDPSVPYHLRVTLGAPITTVAQVDTLPVTPTDDGHHGKLPPQLPPPAPNPPAIAPAAGPSVATTQPSVGAAGSSTTTTQAAGSTITSSSGSSSSGNSGSSGSRSDSNTANPTTTPTPDDPQLSITVPNSMKVEATNPDGASVSYSASASAGAALDCSPGPGTFPITTTTVNCTATGASGKQARASFNITVSDTTGPSLKLPDPITVAAGSGPVSYSASASDAVDPSPSVSCTPASGTAFPFGANSVSCTATDKSGNSTKGGFSVTVTDSSAPVVNVSVSPAPNDKGWNKSDVTVTATATDGSGGSGVKSIREAGGASVAGASMSVPVNAEGQKTLSFTATDVSGNASSAVSRTVKIDKTAPVVHVPSAPIEVEVASSATGATVSYTASASDNLDGSPSFSCGEHPSGSRFGIGPTTVTCTATDAAGNTGSASFSVRVIKATPPPPPPRPNPCSPVFFGPMLADDQVMHDQQAAAIPNCPFPL